MAVVQDSLIREAVAEERFTRVKHYAGYPAHALDYFSKTYELDFDTFDVVAIPWPEQPGAPSKLTNNENPATSLEVLKHRGKAPWKKVVRVDHQTAHAATAFRTSGWKDALIISLDGGGLDSGEPSSGGLFIAEDYEIERQELYGTEANFGVFYGAITEALGWAYADGEGKTMGLAPYGDASRAHRMLSEFIPTVVGTSLRSNKTVHCRFNICNGRFCVDFTDDPFFQAVQTLVSDVGRENVAAAAQKLLEDSLVSLVTNAVEQFGMRRICLSGGVFLNVKANKRIREALPSCELFIPPNPGDGGSALGAALEACFMETGTTPKSRMQTPYLGPEYSTEQIEAELRRPSGRLEFSLSPDVAKEAAKLVANGAVIGWFQGRSEWGPRALGNRSVIALPNSKAVKDRINNLLKQREWFLPFAPSIKEEEAPRYFRRFAESPFMIMSFDISPDREADLAGVIHVDRTVRPHTLSRDDNPRYYSLLSEVESLTNIPAVLNTSFNKHGLPLVESPADAIQHLLWGYIDALVIDDFVAIREKSMV